MKRYGNLYPLITSFENLLLAAKKAEQGKKYKASVLKFNYNFEKEILELQRLLETETYKPGEYNVFFVQESKKRMISAAPYRDRVIHHALCNIIGPLLEKSLIDDCYANRVGFGSHKALRRFTKFARSSKYVLQCDISKYFPTIDHQILKEIIAKKIKCKKTLNLIEKIIDGSNKQEEIIYHFPGDDLFTPMERRKGLPLGNLTSQFFANFYLNEFDHFILEKLKISKYLRYVDDFALFSDDKEVLKNARKEIEEYLEKLRLKIHPIKSQLFETKHGGTFLGFRVFPDRIRVKSDNIKRGIRRLRKVKAQYQQDKITAKEVQAAYRSWFSHLQHGDTWKIREKICQEILQII